MLKWYQARELDVVPVHPVCAEQRFREQETEFELDNDRKEQELEGVKAVSQLSELPSPKETSVSIITPPKVS